MHLEGPWLTTTGKRKGKFKFRSAEQAQKARELAESWEVLLQRHKLESETGNKKALAPLSSPKPFYRGMDQPKIPSLNGGVDSAPALKTPDKIYTGTKIKGIGTMHKSNAVPIFSDEEAVDIAKMRR